MGTPRRTRHDGFLAIRRTGPARRAPHRAADPTGRIMMHRWLVCDHETLPVSSEAMIHVASIDDLAKRITDETAPTSSQFRAVAMRWIASVISSGEVPRLSRTCPAPPVPKEGPELRATLPRSRKAAAGSSPLPGTEFDYSYVTQTGFFITVHGTKNDLVIYSRGPLSRLRRERDRLQPVDADHGFRGRPSVPLPQRLAAECGDGGVEGGQEEQPRPQSQLRGRPGSPSRQSRGGPTRGRRPRSSTRLTRADASATSIWRSPVPRSSRRPPPRTSPFRTVSTT